MRGAFGGSGEGVFHETVNSFHAALRYRGTRIIDWQFKVLLSLLEIAKIKFG